MILISGTSLTAEQLPFAEIMDYTLEPNEQFLKIKLKTIATNPVCLGVYLHKDLEGKFPILPEVEEKLHYFTSDDQLATLLENGGKEEPEPQPEQPTAPEEPIALSFGTTEDTIVDSQPEAFTTPPPESISVPQQAEHKTGGFTLIDTVDVETDYTDFLFEIPNVSEDTDSFKQQLQNKERIIAQKDLQISEMNKSLNDLYKLQDIQLAEIKDVYDKRIDEANTALSEAKQKLSEAAIPEDLHGFLKYASYAQNYKASLKEGYSQEDLRKLGKLTSKIHIFATASGDSYHTFMKAFNDLVEKKPNALIVDFSNDQYLNSKHRLKTKDSSMHLKDKTVNISDLVKDIKGTQVIPTTFYNDITLLTLDWLDIIKRLNAYAKGRPIIFVFNSINSFAVRYTVSKLGTIGEATIFVKCNPVILTSLFGDMVFIPENRFKIVALDYIDIVKQLLTHMGDKYKVLAFRENDLEWKKIGVSI